MITPSEWSAIGCSLSIATAALVISFPAGILLGWIFARKTFPGKIVLEVLTFLPLVLPPVVTGYLILYLFGRNGLLWSGPHALTGIDIVFTWKGMVLAGAVVGFPLMVRSIRAAIETVDPHLEQAAHTLGSSRLRTFFRITLPLAWPGLVAGAVLGFARALGEFGATRMVALNTDGTRTIALEVFQLMDTPGSDTGPVVRLVLVSILLSALALGICEIMVRRWKGAGS